MEHDSIPANRKPVNARHPRNRATSGHCLILAPAISEVLSGSTRLSIHLRTYSRNHGVGRRRTYCAANLSAAGAQAEPACFASRPRSVRRRGIHHPADIDCAAPFPRRQRRLRPPMGRQLALLPLHAGIRERVGGSGSCSGHRTHLSRSARTTLAPQARRHRLTASHSLSAPVSPGTDGLSRHAQDFMPRHTILRST